MSATKLFYNQLKKSNIMLMSFFIAALTQTKRDCFSDSLYVLLLVRFYFLRLKLNVQYDETLHCNNIYAIILLGIPFRYWWVEL